MSESTYILRGGALGAERLRVLAAAMRPATLALLDRAGIADGEAVLDGGCGGGEVAMELARRVRAGGRVVAVDADGAVVALAREAAEARGLGIEWRVGRVEGLAEREAFDVVYARFLLSHLHDPSAAVVRLATALRPGGRLVVEDIDIGQHACWPPSPAFRRYVELYTATARLRGADPGLGPRLASLLVDAGFADVEVATSMPVFREGEGKTIARRTLAGIAAAAIAAGLTDAEEIDALLAELERHERDPRSIQSTAQVFQVVGQRV